MSCNCTSYTPEQLKDAKDAYFRIASGQNVTVVIDQNGERIEFICIGGFNSSNGDGTTRLRYA